MLVPLFDNRMTFRIARNLRAFFNLQVGLTRGETPQERSERNLEERNLQITTLKQQLARRDQNLDRERGKLKEQEDKLEEQTRSISALKAEVARVMTPSIRDVDRLEVFGRLLGTMKPGRLLDLACGHGKFSLVARDLGWSVTAVDVRTSRMPAEEGIEWVESDVRVFDLDREDYDCISILGLLYHLELSDQLELLRRCAGTPTIVDTHVTSRTDHQELGYRGTLFEEVPGATDEQRAAVATASWGNESSFWPTGDSLLDMLHDCGFQNVFELSPRYTPNRTFYICL